MNFPQLTPGESAVAMYIALQVYNAIVQSLPNPDSLPNPNSTGGIWYRAVYNFLSIIGNDFKSFVQAKTGTSTTTSAILTPGSVEVSKTTSVTTK